MYKSAKCSPSDASRNPRLFYGLADHDTIFLELFGQDCVEEGIAARVERQDENGEDFGRVQRDEVGSKTRRQSQEGDRGPTDEVGEHQQGHPFGDPVEEKHSSS